jgi:eukaryotic-like serine/threonine-protein kinase
LPRDACVKPRRSPNRNSRLLRGLRLHDRFAVGAASTVHFGWLARGLVCVKRMHPFHAVAENATNVEHPNVVATLGVVRHGGELRAAMEYVPGASLKEIIEGRSLPPRIAGAIVAGALHGVHAAHETRRTAVPRGLSPSSILVGDDGRARLLDLDVHGPSTAAAIVEKLPYAAPEEVVRRDVDLRRDVWAAGVILWESLSGRSLFHGETVASTLRAILEKAVPAIDPTFDQIIARALARDRDDRYASAHSMAIELEKTSCASADEVACALAGLDMRCISRRRVIADAVRRRERMGLHTECNDGIPKG